MTEYLRKQLIGAREWAKECPDDVLAQKHLEELEEIELQQVGGGGFEGSCG